MKKLNRVLALVLTLCMVLTLVPTALAAETKTGITAETNLSAPSVELKNAVNNVEVETAVNTAVTVEKIENPTKDLKLDSESDIQTEALGYDAEDLVTVIVVMEEDSLLDQGYSKKQIAANAAAIQAAKDALALKQETLLTNIAALTGTEVAAGYSYSVIVSGFSVEVPYGKLSEIRAMDGVRTAFVAPVFAVPEDMTPNSTGVGTNMYATSESFGSALTWQTAGYTGAGMRIAILDTGLDTDHPSFVDAPETTETSLTAEEIAGVIGNTNAAARYNAVYGMDLTAEKVYHSEKIPFGFNYGSNSLDVTHDHDEVGDHGTHVAGIAAANAIDTTEVVGVAPDAQVIVMKVFQPTGGAVFSDILAALEDCYWLNVDAVNMSVGSAAGFTSTGDAFWDEIFAKITENDMIAAVSAGNSSSAALMNGYGTNTNLTADPDNGIVSSPATWEGATMIASIENVSTMSLYFVVGDKQIAYNDIAATPLYTLAGSQLEYVMVPGLGTAADFAEVDVAGKVAVVSRGEIAFTEKQANAYAAGAMACIVYDNVEGDMIYMEDAGLLPNAFISKADGEAMAAASADGIGTMTVMGPYDYMTTPSAIAGQMSDFSSWGVNPDLELAPDVTAPGGNIYSSVDDGKYGIMSGTSMSAPHVAGMAALVLQYLHETHPEMTDAQMHTVAEALIMSTATPAVDYTNEVVYPDGIEYSPRKQGSGVANVYDAVTSGSYLTVNGSTPKVSMGDNDTKSGNFTFSFEINNFSEQTQSYALSGSAMTDFVDTSYSAYGYLFMSEAAYGLRAVPTFYIQEGNVDTVYDVNGDEVCNLDDVQALLDLIVGLTQFPDCVGFDVDFDDNGVVDTADAQLLYELITSGLTESDMVVVEAGETVSVNVELQLTEWDMAYMETFYENGIYVDGFVRLYSLDENGVDLSLPFVGFYGDWSAARVYDGGWYYQTEEEREINRYVNVLWTDYGTDNSYYLGVNPYMEEAYDPAHNVLSPNGDHYWDTIEEIYLSMMRGAKTLSFTYADAETGEELYSKTAEWVRKSYYLPAYGLNYPFVYSDYLEERYDFTDAQGNYLPSGTKLTLTIEACLDDGDEVVDDVIQVPIVIDTEAPVIYTDEIAYLYNPYADSRRLEFYVSDNYDIAAVIAMTAAGDGMAYYAVEDLPGEKTLMSIDVSDFDSEFVLAVCDYGGNETFYEISFAGEQNYGDDDFFGFRRVAVIPSGNYLYTTDGLNGWLSFETPDQVVQHTNIYMGAGETNVNAADFVGEYLIGIDTEGTIFALKPGAWTRMPFGSFRLGDLAYPALDMTYDVKNDVLYVLTDELTAGEGGHLVTLDYLSGEVTDLGVITGFEGDESKGKSAQGLTLAADNDGVLYSINYNNGDLYTIDPATCEATFVGATGYDPSGMQSMTVDHDTNKLYWAAYQGYTGTSVFFEVDKTEGKLTMVCQPQYNSEITALLKPYEVDGLYPEAVAPRALRLSESTVYTTVGSTVEVSCTPEPYYAEMESLTWSSNDETVATVNNGTITANAVGETVITVTCGNVYAELTVIVNAYAGELTYFDMGMNYLWMKSNVANPAGAEIYENGQTSNYGFTAAAYANGYVYAADYDNLFYRLNPETMAGEKLGSTDGLTLAMTFNYADGYMYAIQQAGSFWDVFYYLVRINLATGESQQLHQFDVASTGTPIGGLAADYEGNIRLISMVQDPDTWETTYEMHTIHVTDGENGAEVGFADPISLPIGFYNYCSLVYSAENGGYFWADDMGTLYHIDVTDPTAPVVVPLGMVAEELGGAWPLAMFMIPENEPETNYAEPTSIAIPSSYQLLAGGSVSVGLSVMPWNANVSAAYTTEDPNVATVSADGIITGVGEGTTTLAVYISELDVTLEAPITVLPSAGTLYGHVILDFANYGSDFYGAFSDTNPADCQLLDINPYAQGYADYDAPEVMSILAGAYYDGQLYAYMQVMDNATYQVSYNMGIIDLTDYSYEKLAVSAYTVRDMEFDYTTGTMYAVVHGGNVKGALAQVDMTTGEVYLVGDSGITMATVTVDAEGTVYAISQDGDLYTMDKTTGEATFIGKTGAIADIFQSMHYDHNTGNIYWAQADSNYT
ncbi:MAG: S8 family serine peptidase, partial [Oscillospiraceae bacterium]|nr:S8 family serine peptidase [Oscillospiraceae bacterium]